MVKLVISDAEHSAAFTSRTSRALQIRDSRVNARVSSLTILSFSYQISLDSA